MTDCVGVYVHFPFCVQKCLYCDFVSYSRSTGMHALIPEYVEALREEIRLRAHSTGPLPVGSVFFGGGTPTLVPPTLLIAVLEAVRRNYSVSPCAEITVEANPGTVSSASLRQLKQGGFNRVSLGVQSFDDVVLRRLGRIHTSAQAAQAFSLAREAGFSNINLDLMFAVPGQSLASWVQTLRTACQLGPEHVSAYSLIIEDETPFARWFEQGLLDVPSEDESADMMEKAADILAEGGLLRYEISNYAKPGYESIHNQVYWENRPYIGFGAAAHSYWQRERSSNTDSIPHYIDSIRAGRRPVEFSERLDLRGQMGETVVLGLRLLRGVDLGRFRRRFGVDLTQVYPKEVQELLELGMAEITGGEPGYFRLTARGLEVANQVMARFV